MKYEYKVGDRMRYRYSSRFPKTIPLHYWVFVSKGTGISNKIYHAAPRIV